MTILPKKQCTWDESWLWTGKVITKSNSVSGQDERQIRKRLLLQLRHWRYGVYRSLHFAVSCPIPIHILFFRVIRLFWKTNFLMKQLQIKFLIGIWPWKLRGVGMVLLDRIVRTVGAKEAEAVTGSISLRFSSSSCWPLLMFFIHSAPWKTMVQNPHRSFKERGREY